MNARFVTRRPAFSAGNSLSEIKTIRDIIDSTIWFRRYTKMCHYHQIRTDLFFVSPEHNRRRSSPRSRSPPAAYSMTTAKKCTVENRGTSQLPRRNFFPCTVHVASSSVISGEECRRGSFHVHSRNIPAAWKYRDWTNSVAYIGCVFERGKIVNRSLKRDFEAQRNVSDTLKVRIVCVIGQVWFMLKMNYTLYLRLLQLGLSETNRNETDVSSLISNCAMNEVFFNGLNGRILFVSFADTGRNRA